MAATTKPASANASAVSPWPPNHPPRPWEKITSGSFAPVTGQSFTPVSPISTGGSSLPSGTCFGSPAHGYQTAPAKFGSESSSWMPADRAGAPRQQREPRQQSMTAQAQYFPSTKAAPNPANATDRTTTTELCRQLPKSRNTDLLPVEPGVTLACAIFGILNDLPELPARK